MRKFKGILLCLVMLFLFVTRVSAVEQEQEVQPSELLLLEEIPIMVTAAKKIQPITEMSIGTLKLGSLYTCFGTLWDHTYYGSVICYKGYMDEADRQVALEADTTYSLGSLTLSSVYVFYDHNFDNKNLPLRGSLFLAEAYFEIYKNEEAKFLKNTTLRYNFSKDYPDRGTGLGRLHLAALSFKFIDNFKMDIIRVDWRSGDTVKDKSWRLSFSQTFNGGE